MGKLSDRAVKTLGAGRYDDGDGLRLMVSASGKRSWILRFQLQGRRRDMGLGSYPTVSLADARERAGDARKLVRRGADPIDASKAAKKGDGRIPTFREVAALVIKDGQARTTNAKVAYQIERHLGEAYCADLLGRPVNEITTIDVAAQLRAVWKEKPEVARKLHTAIRRVFDRARVILKAEHGVVALENPANWADLKAQGFEAPKALSRGRHPSLAYSRLPQFMAALREREATAARLLEFVILTNVRTDAALRAQWAEFDLDAGLWTIPLDRLKDRKSRTDPFRVPLSPPAVAILLAQAEAQIGQFVFTGNKDRLLSNMAMLTLLKRMNGGESPTWTDDTSKRPIVVHGFRATFRTWAEEASQASHAVIEDAMGHAVGNVVERAYRRTDVLEKRRALMDQWAEFCAPTKESGGIAPAQGSDAR